MPTALDQVTETQAQKAATVNENFEAVCMAGMFGRRATTSSALTWGYYGGTLYVDGVPSTIANGTLALTASQTNYIEATRAGTVSANIVGFTAGRIPLYIAVTSGSAVTSYTDCREFGETFRRSFAFVEMGGSPNTITLSAAQARCDALHLRGASSDCTLVVPQVPWHWVMFNDTAYTVTVTTAVGGSPTPATLAIAAGTSNHAMSDGTNVRSALSGFAGTVTSVALTAPTFLSVAGSPIIGSGTLALTLATQSANTALLGPRSGSAAVPAFRTFGPADTGSGIGGRLTLTSATPVMTADVTAATTIYWTPYNGGSIPIYDGTDMVWFTPGELSQTTADNTKSPAAVANSSVYDLFVWSDSGTLRCTRGPAWTSDTGRGTGAGTSELQMLAGILTNKVAITNGPGANRGTYVGSVRSNGSAQIDYKLGTAAASGGEAWIGVWNMYNRVDVQPAVQDTVDSYTLQSTTVRAMNNSNTNRISILQGLKEDAVFALQEQFAITNASVEQAITGIGLNATNAFAAGSSVGPTGNVASLQANMHAAWAGSFLGFNYLQVVERCSAAVAPVTFYGDAGVTYVRQQFSARLRA